MLRQVRKDTDDVDLQPDAMKEGCGGLPAADLPSGCWRAHVFDGGDPSETLRRRYEGRQYVGIHLHKSSSVVVRKMDIGELLEAVQITNSPLALAEAMTRAGEPRGRHRGDLRRVLGGRHLGRVRREHAPGSPTGCEGLRVPTGAMPNSA